MATIFPQNPLVGDKYTIGTTTYQWTGSAWVKISATTQLETLTLANLTATNSIRVTAATSATSVGTGALVVAGGISAGGDLWLGGTIYSAGVPVITTTTLIESIVSGEDIRVISTITGLTTATTLIISNTSTLQTVTGRGSSTNHIVYFTNPTNSTSSNTGAVIVTGGVGVGGRINAESVQIADAILDSGQVLVNTTSSVVVDSYSIDDFRSAKYLIQITEGTGSGARFETIEILLLVDNDQNVYATEYAILVSDDDLGDFSADVQGDNMVRLYFTASDSAPRTLKIFRTTMRV